jgi:hypothetical protein
MRNDRGAGDVVPAELHPSRLPQNLGRDDPHAIVAMTVVRRSGKVKIASATNFGAGAIGT